MVSSSLMGRLGNTLFQIAAAYSLAMDNHDELIYNINELQFDHHTIDLYKKTIFRKLNFTSELLRFNHIHREPHFHFSKIDFLPNTKIHGYFQSEKYFKKNENKIKSLFEIDETTLHQIQTKYGSILDNETCSIHVRRGDYLGLQEYHPTCNMSYFNEAISKINNNIYLIFSDDISWCKENFVGDNFIFVEGNNDVTDLYLMSMCSNNIISNSSYSWWAAWLNQNETKKVVAPKIWFGPSYSNMITDDIYCDKWIIC